MNAKIFKQIRKQFKNPLITLFTLAVLFYKLLPSFIKNLLVSNIKIRESVVKASGGQKNRFYIKMLLQQSHKDLIKNLVSNYEK